MTIAICSYLWKRLSVLQVDAVPRIGEGVDVWCNPCPRVKDVVWYPSAATREHLRGLGMDLPEDITAIVFVE